MSRTMTVAERELFLADVHVGVISIAEDGRAPLTIPIWYGYTPGGDVSIWTAKASRKALLLQQAGRFSLCVQNEQRPYKYVSVEGPITSIEPVDVERDARSIRKRYLGEEAAANTTVKEDEILFRMRPEHWLTGDYT